jgi:hypothetical protein
MSMKPASGEVCSYSHILSMSWSFLSNPRYSFKLNGEHIFRIGTHVTRIYRVIVTRALRQALPASVSVYSEQL